MGQYVYAHYSLTWLPPAAQYLQAICWLHDNIIIPLYIGVCAYEVTISLLQVRVKRCRQYLSKKSKHSQQGSTAAL